MREDRPRRKPGSRLKWIGIILTLVGIAWAWRVGTAVGERAIERDPMLLLGPMLLICPGLLLIIISRLVAFFARPSRWAARQAMGSAADRVEDLLD